MITSHSVATQEKDHNANPEPGIPLIDITGFDVGDTIRDAEIAAQIRAACLDKGFFYVTGHGIPEALLEQMYGITKSFFDLPIEEKSKVSKDNSSYNRGYEPMAAQTLEPGAPPDQKEGYYIGVEIPEGDARVQAGKFNHGPNQWPDQPEDFRSISESYYRKMTELGTRLMAAIALSLGLHRDYFSAFTSDPMCTLRMLHYPPQRPLAPEDEKGCGAHTDFGGLTLLWQDEVGGLEVLDQQSNEWVAAPPIKGAYVVNLGDMIQRWTNGMYRSNLHRVINRSGRERYSIPFFFTGNPDHEVACIEACLQDGEEPKSEPITVLEHIQEMYRRTYA